MSDINVDNINVETKPTSVNATLQPLAIPKKQLHTFAVDTGTNSNMCNSKLLFLSLHKHDKTTKKSTWEMVNLHTKSMS